MNSALYMLGNSLANFSATTAAVEFAVNWLVQSTLLIAAGLLLASWCRQKGSAAQSLIYRTTLVAVLICPLATWGLARCGVSGWSIRLPNAARLPALETSKPKPSFNQKISSVPAMPRAQTTADVPPASSANSTANDRLGTAAVADPATIVLSPPDLQAAQSSPVETVSVASPEATEPASLVKPPRTSPAREFTLLRTLTACVAIAWLLTSSTLLIRLFAAWCRLSQLIRAAHPTDTTTQRLCSEFAATIGVSSPKVLRSPFLTSPCLAGLGLTHQSTILLPEEQLHLPMRDVLVHELAHLHRRDVHWNLLRKVATAIYFFQPLLWILSRRIEFTAEEVCDDFVVQHGGDRSDYANQLVDIAELSADVSAADVSAVAVAAAGVGIVSLRSMLKHRVERILDNSRELSTRVGSLLLLAVLLIGIASTVVVGLVGLNAPTLAQESAITELSNKLSNKLPDRLKDKNPSTPATDQPALGVKVNGSVVDANDRPIIGATVKAVRSRLLPGQPYGSYEYDPVATVQTGESGQFEMNIPPAKELPDGLAAHWQWKPADLIATAPGYALNWSSQANKKGEAEKVAATPSVKIALTQSTPPLEGKLLWPDGTPAVGVQVAVKGLADTVSDDIKNWIENNQSEAPKDTYEPNSHNLFGIHHPAFPASVQSDDSGRFEIAGISAEHKSLLELSGQDVMHESVHVVNEAMKPFDVVKQHYYGSQFTHTVTRGVTVEGRVVDVETGDPIVGVKVAPSIFDDNGTGMNLGARTATDADGYYRIEGLPPTTKNYLRMIPTRDQPYLVARDIEIPKREGTQPLTMDLKLRRGVFVRGRVTESGNGRPVEADVVYFPFKSNENAKRYARFRTEKSRMLPKGVATNEDGKFQIVAIPGSGILAVNGKRPAEWRAGYGAEAITGFQNSNRAFDTYDHCMPSTYNGLVEIEIAEGKSEVSQNLQVDRGNVVRLRPVDHERTPLASVEVLYGASVSSFSVSSSAIVQQGSESIEISALRPDEKRHIILRQRELGLACFVTVQAPQETAEQTIHDVLLKPCAVVTGKLLDEAGKPVGGLTLSATGGPTTRWRSQVESTQTEKDGSFRFEQLVPGAIYEIAPPHVYGTKFDHVTFARELKLDAGETVDLGQISWSSPHRPEPVRTKTSEPAIKALASENEKSDDRISGVVVGANGKRVVGAKFYWMTYRSYELDSTPPKLVATSNERGEFSFSNPSLNLAPDAPATWDYLQYMVVKAPGHGFSVERPGDLLRKSREEETLVGRVISAIADRKGAVVALPAAGNPLRGRVVDIDGNGVADATIRIKWFHGDGLDRFGRPASPEGKFADSTPRQWTGHINSLINIVEPPQAIDVFPMATTDSEGRFELKDSGADRLFELLVEGERIEFARIIARNQPGEKVTVTSDYYRPDDTYVVHPQEILHVAGPSIPVEGRVVDFDTGEPIAQALVRANTIHGSNSAISNSERQFTTHTDSKGNYRITGLPVGNGNRLVCICRKSDIPYPTMGSKADTSKSLDVLKQDIRMKRGVWAEGRVFDADTKLPMAGSIAYYFFRNQELLEELPGIRYTHVQWAWWTNRAGYFRVPVLPTRGFLAYRHDAVSHDEAMNPTIDRYARGQGAESIEGMDDGMQAFATFPTYLMVENYQRLVEIDPDGSEESINADMPMVKSQKRFARPVWPDGVSVGEYQAFGGSRNWGWEEVDTAKFEIKGLKTGEERKVFVYHRESNLVGMAVVKANDADAASVADQATSIEGQAIEVQTAGTIIGRLLDADGEPVTDARLHWPYESSDDLSAGIWAPHPGKRRNPSVIEVDKEGRFRLTGIVPGLNYTASATANRKSYTDRITDQHIGNPFTNVSVEPGETKDVGEIRAGADGVFKQDE